MDKPLDKAEFKMPHDLHSLRPFISPIPEILIIVGPQIPILRYSQGFTLYYRLLGFSGANKNTPFYFPHIEVRHRTEK